MTFDVGPAEPWQILVAALVSFFVGAINPATIIARARGIDLRAEGSGNPGATNTARVMGRKTGIAVGVIDVLKGLIPVLVFGAWGHAAAGVAGIAAVLGHIFSPFLGWRGGKGVATTGGALLGFYPIWALPVMAGFALGLVVTKRMGLAAVTAALVLMACGLWWPDVLLPETVFAVGLGIVVIARHWRNIAAAWRDWRGPAGGAGPAPE